MYPGAERRMSTIGMSQPESGRDDARQEIETSLSLYWDITRTFLPRFLFLTYPRQRYGPKTVMQAIVYITYWFQALFLRIVYLNIRVFYLRVLYVIVR